MFYSLDHLERKPLFQPYELVESSKSSALRAGTTSQLPEKRHSKRFVTGHGFTHGLKLARAVGGDSSAASRQQNQDGLQPLRYAFCGFRVNQASFAAYSLAPPNPVQAKGGNVCMRTSFSVTKAIQGQRSPSSQPRTSAWVPAIISHVRAESPAHRFEAIANAPTTGLTQSFQPMSTPDRKFAGKQVFPWELFPSPA